jgi:WD40 repeat protein
MPTDSEDSRPLQFFPVAIGHYDHHDPIDTAVEVEGVAELLVPFGAEIHPWQVADEDRGADAVEERLNAWAAPTTSGDTFLYWLGHGESDGLSARLAHARSPRPLTAGGMTPKEVVGYLASRQAHKLADGTWAIVVIDACRSARFVQLMSAAASEDPTGGPRNVLMVATSDEGIANLGRFRKALATALTVNFPAESSISLWTLAEELNRSLPGCPVMPHLIEPTAALQRKVSPLAGTITAPLDVLADIEAVLEGFTEDERRHFIPKASGAEFGEQAWYFEGRSAERDQLLNWLDTAEDGLAIVTGASGAGKSALLGHVLVRTRPQLSILLEHTGQLEPLPSDAPHPRDPFDAVLHLSGATPQDVVSRIAKAAGLPTPPTDPSPTVQTDWLHEQMQERNKPFTLLADGLDEGHLPEVTAQRILRRLAKLPRLRVIVGTRRSTREGPDFPRPDDEDLLDALGRADLSIDVPRDGDAVTRYVRRRLTDAVSARPDLCPSERIEEVAGAIGGRDREFLYARLAVHEILQNPTLLTWEAQDELNALLDGDHRSLFGRAVDRLAAGAEANGPLIEALALAQGHGMPLRDGVWASAATAIADGLTVSDQHIDTLTRSAAPYLMLDVEFGQSVYRLAHRTFAEHFRAPSLPDPRHHHISALLTTEVESRLPDHDLNPYISHYLPAHAALGGVEAWEDLAGHPRVLDRLDPTAVTTNVMLHTFGRSKLPPAIAGVLGAQHMLAGAMPGDRRGIRELASARYADHSEKALPRSEAHDPVCAWTVKWAHLPRHSVHLALTGHSGGVGAVAAFTGRDGRVRLVSGGGDGMVRIWDADSGTQLAAWPSEVSWVGAATAYTSRDGGVRLATGGDFGDGAVRIWGLDDGVELAVWPSRGGSVGAVASFSDAEGRGRLVSGGGDGVLRIWDTESGEELAELTGHTGSVWAIAPFTVEDDGVRLVSGSGDGTARVWDLDRGCELAVLAGHVGRVWAVTTFTGRDDRVYVATGGDDGHVRIWVAEAGVEVAAWVCHDGGVWAVEALKGEDGEARLATVGNDGTVRIWDPWTGSELGMLAGHSRSLGSVAAFVGTGDRVRLATGGTDGTVRIWDAASGTERVEPVDQIGDTLAVALFAGTDGDARLVTGGADGMVRICDVDTGNEVSAWLGHVGGIHVVETFIAGDGSVQVVTGGADGVVRIWNPEGGVQLFALNGHADSVGSVTAFAGVDGLTQLVTSGVDGTVRIWDPSRGDHLAPWGGRGRGVGAVTTYTGTDGDVRLALGGADGVVRIWDLHGGTPVATLTGHVGEVGAVAAFTGSDGRARLITGGADGTVRIWDVEGGTAPTRLTGHFGGVRAVAAFTGLDGRIRLVAGYEGLVQIWDPVSGQVELTVPLGTSVRDVAVLGVDLSIATEEGIVHISLRQPV